MKYYLIAGEASGDLHGSNLMKELKLADSNAGFRFFGGDLMAAVQNNLVKHYREMAFMGLLDVFMNIKTIKRNMEFCKKDLLEYKPDVLILIDYPGFNLRIAEFAKQHNIKVFYYISPKIWAWKEYRVKKIKAFVNEMFTILPFETAFYKKHDYKVNYVGNPLMDSLAEHRTGNTASGFVERNKLDKRKIVALLAGSRIKEIKRILPLMVEATKGRNDFQFVLAGVNTIEKKVYNEIIGEANIKLIFNQTYDLLSNSYAALVTSGTAALETALFKVPQTVLYKVEGGRLVDFIMRNYVLKTKWASLPNIILQKAAIKEYIQNDMKLQNVNAELDLLLFDEKYRKKIFEDYSEMNKLMGEKGCSKRAAELMTHMLNEQR